MTSFLRSSTGALSITMLSLSLTGCPDSSDGIVRECDDALAAAEGTPCEFMGLCGMLCPGTAVQCAGGVTRRVVARCDAGELPDASVPGDAYAEDTTALDAGLIDDASTDVGMCTVAEPSGVTPCRSDADCSSAAFERCIAPDESGGCGACMDPPNDCVIDSDCPSMDGVQYVCEEAEVSCPCSGDGVGTYCIAPCSVTGCDDGFTCASSGHCTADPCGDDDFTCPLGTTCTPTGTSDDHGCLRTTCTTDADCPCGAGCVEGRCFDTLGTCEPPRA